MGISTHTVPIVAVIAAFIASGFHANAAPAGHTCDPVDPVLEQGWNVVPSDETVNEVDSAPFPDGGRGDWYVTRTTTYIPFCNYYNEIGIYSLRSYSLAPRQREERIHICQATRSSSIAVPPYTGACPPR